LNSSIPHRAIALMGATGTGKSALAIEVARITHSAIISCDSMQLYRGLDIGTAKASKSEQATVPHYLIDCAEIHDIWSAQRWADAALAIIKTENRAGRTPIITGGTGMYLRALVEGFADIPAEKSGVRETLNQQQREHGTPYLHNMLMQCDAPLATRLPKNDTQRIIRGLCVWQSTDKALSAWQAEQAAKHEIIDCPTFVLDIPRPLLRQRLADRIHLMMQQGWLNEVRWLDQQKVPELHPALRAVGYRQLLNHLHGNCTLEDAVRDAITATHKYAKRQVTWFRNQTPNAVIGDATTLNAAMLEILNRWT